MLGMARFVLFGVLCQMLAAAASAPSCSIESATTAEQRVWLLCSDGRIYVSPDQGVNWQAHALPSGLQYRSVFFLDSRRGFVAGDSGTLMATEDGGASWRRVAVPVKDNLRSVYFRGDQGWISGYHGVMLHSADGGRSWTNQPTGVSSTIEAVFFLDATHGWAVGWIGTMIRTTDGGQTWQQMRPPPAVLWSLGSVYFRDARNGWIVGFHGQILRSRDGGLTWTMQTSPTTAWLTSVRFDSAGRGWIAAENSLLVSEDGGATWRVGAKSDAVFLRRLLPVNGTLWAIGQYTILRQATEGSKWETVERVTLG
jgi:photosystem II stability/assembly factor-like uncharacterized protein